MARDLCDTESDIITDPEYWNDRCAQGLRALQYRSLTVEQVAALTLFVETLVYAQPARKVTKSSVAPVLRLRSV